MIYHGESDPS